MSLIIFFTLAKGSEAALSATKAKNRLPLAFAFALSISTTRCCSAGLDEPLCTKDEEACTCISAGRYLSACPFTESLERIPTASSIALISSTRVTWFFSYSLERKAHSTLVSASTFSSSFLDVEVVARSALEDAASSRASALRSVFCPTSFLSKAMSSISCCFSVSKFALAFISSFSTTVSCSLNPLSNFSNNLTTPPDWNS
mmetsp:Transcript_89953/g.178755  ORF Transcript_89953/g.178755 Transcript_89953/m.178755 type:complete len:202 (-) Transcript_89953:669-1274(-)